MRAWLSSGLVGTLPRYFFTPNITKPHARFPKDRRCYGQHLTATDTMKTVAHFLTP